MARAAGSRSKKAPVWVLPADFGIESLAATAAEFQARGPVAADLAINAAAVQRLHAASLQWLLAVALAARAAGHAFSLLEPSAVLRDAARRLGVAPELMMSTDKDCV